MLKKLLPMIASIVLSVAANASPQTITGTVTDTMCGKKHMMPGKSDAECTRVCMKSKGKWTYGLIVGDTVYSMVGDAKRFDAVAGKKVKVDGDVAGTTITVKDIAEIK